MKFIDKYQVIAKVGTASVELKKELSEYEFDGVVDFSYAPSGVMDPENLMVIRTDNYLKEVDDCEKDYYLMENGKLKEAGLTLRAFQSAALPLKKDFNLQDFFDKNKDASCIIFYINSEYPYTVFHPGNVIRCAVID